MKPDSFNRLTHEQLQELFGRMAEIEYESPPISNAYEASSLISGRSHSDAVMTYIPEASREDTDSRMRTVLPTSRFVRQPVKVNRPHALAIATYSVLTACHDSFAV